MAFAASFPHENRAIGWKVLNSVGKLVISESLVPRGPQGQRRPADTAIRVAKIATGEVAEDWPTLERTISGCSASAQAPFRDACLELGG